MGVRGIRDTMKVVATLALLSAVTQHSNAVSSFDYSQITQLHNAVQQTSTAAPTNATLRALARVADKCRKAKEQWKKAKLTLDQGTLKAEEFRETLERISRGEIEESACRSNEVVISDDKIKKIVEKLENSVDVIDANRANLSRHSMEHERLINRFLTLLDRARKAKSKNYSYDNSFNTSREIIEINNITNIVKECKIDFQPAIAEYVKLSLSIKAVLAGLKVDQASARPVEDMDQFLSDIWS